MKLVYKLGCILGLLLLLPVSALAHDIYQMGEASWYGESDHGNLTANGEIYDSFAMTAAHLTLRFGTLVKVTNVHNGKSVVVRINDRGPYAKGRIIDLSYGAANAIDMVQSGIAPVLLEIVSMPDRPESAYNRVEDAEIANIQLGLFSTRARAESFINPLLAMESSYPYQPTIEETTSGKFRITIYGVVQTDLEGYTELLGSLGYSDLYRYDANPLTPAVQLPSNPEGNKDQPSNGQTNAQSDNQRGQEADYE